MRTWKYGTSYSLDIKLLALVNEVDYTALGLKKIKITMSMLDICITLLMWVSLYEIDLRHYKKAYAYI